MATITKLYDYTTLEELGKLLRTLTDAGIRSFRIYAHRVEAVARYDQDRLRGVLSE